jgi:hypothetical protein
MTWIALLLAAAPPKLRPPGNPPLCRGNPALAGKCYTIHGRFRAYNGNPTFRIWPIGTARLIGVTGAKPGDPPIMPESLACGFYCDVVADFEMCPFSGTKPGVMQRACIEGAGGRVTY